MANMSYCRFQNTDSDLADCYNNMGVDIEEMSQEELDAMISIVEMAHQIADDYDKTDIQQWKEDFDEANKSEEEAD